MVLIHESDIGPLADIDMQVALMRDKDPDDHCWHVDIPEGATIESVMDQLIHLGFMPTRVKINKVFFGKDS